MKKGTPLPPPPSPKQLKKFNDDLGLAGLTDIAILKADNEHNKTHIKAIAGLFIAFVIAVSLGAAGLYLKVQDSIGAAENRLENRIDRLDDRLTGAMGKLEDSVTQRLSTSNGNGNTSSNGSSAGTEAQKPSIPVEQTQPKAETPAAPQQ